MDGRLHKIGRELIWTYDWDHPMEPWKVHQMFGTWSGTVVSEDERELRITDAQGFAEESRSRW